MTRDTNGYTLNKPAHLTCPDCGGALTRVDDGPMPKYVCHIGHMLTGEAMLIAQAERIEGSLGNSLAMLNERRELCRQLIETGLYEKERLEPLLRDATRHAELLRDFLNGCKAPNTV